MMKTQKSYFFLSLLAIAGLFFSCQDVIQVDLNSANPVVVVEGSISNGKTCSLQLTYTTDYFNPGTPASIDNAVVILTSSAGESETLTNQGSGNYAGETIMGQDNKEYSLKITIGDKEFNGSSTLQTQARFKNISFKEQSFNQPGSPQQEGASYSLSLLFTDDTLQTNYYWVKISQVGRGQTNRYQLLEDSQYATNGTIAYSPMMGSFHAGDTVTVSVISLDKGTYQYYNQMNDMVSGIMGSSSTPYNPKSNMGDDALGYFSACSSTDTTLIVGIPK
jgi:hypothetical protein